jgi:hypothetical protein
VIEGMVENLSAKILHDDRKSLSHWLRSQDKYMQLEKRKIVETAWSDLGWADRIRRIRVVAPFGIFFYCLFAKGAILDGYAGLYYAFQRLLSELILSLYLFEDHKTLRAECEELPLRAEREEQLQIPQQR